MKNENRLRKKHFVDIEVLLKTAEDNGMGLEVEWVCDHTPTADAVEVVHGRWNEINQITTGLPWKYRCNECGCPQDYAHNYCPNCGAKMDGDGNV